MGTLSNVWEIKQIKIFRDKKIGEGATGSVYKGTYEADYNQVAVKLVTKQTDLFKWKELEVLRTVDHSNIVRYFAAEPFGNNDWAIVLELANTDLEKWLSNGESKSVQTIKSILKNSAEGLNHLHCLDPVIIHRDMKPSNVLLVIGKDGSVIAKLADFGISRIVMPTKSGVTTTNPGIGTNNWIPPEALLADSSEKFVLETSFDIYSFGLVIYYVLCDRKHLFSSSEADPEHVINLKIVKDNRNWKYESEYCKQIEYKSFVNSLTNFTPTERPKMQSILQHPFFWDFNHGLSFIQAVSMDLDKTNEENCGQIRSKIDQVFAKLWEGQDWDQRLCADVKEFKHYIESAATKQTKTPKKYNAKLCTDLIEFIYDKDRHYGSWKKNEKLTAPSTFGLNGSNYGEYFISRFPELIPTLFDLLHKEENANYRSTKLSPFFVEVPNSCFTTKKSKTL